MTRRNGDNLNGDNRCHNGDILSHNGENATSQNGENDSSYLHLLKMWFNIAHAFLVCNDYGNVCDMFEIYCYHIFQTHISQTLIILPSMGTQLAFFMISVNNH